VSAAVEVTHDREARRFGARVDGVDCELDYSVQGRVMTILHTGVPAAVGGRGVAGAMTQAAIAFARESGFKVRPACSYAALWFRRHPEHADLLA
jgi:predicted GNAT family acetyltransferase